MNKNQKTDRRSLYKLLGDLPPLNSNFSAEQISRNEQNGYILEKLILNLNGTEPVPAYFVKPADSDAQVPCILYNHAHGDDYKLGKDELLIGREILQAPPYAEVLTKLGWGALCIDAWCFGERSGRSESDTFKEMLWSGQVLWGKMVYDSLQALDYLISRPDVQNERIGTMGMSMGSTMAWWISALDTRIKFCVDICCLTDFQSLIEENGLNAHGIYYFVPSLLKHFSTTDINALIAPRPHFSLAGSKDKLTPSAGLERIDDKLKQIYKDCGAEEAWKLIVYNTGHFETPQMRSDIISFLKRLDKSAHIMLH